MLQATSLFRVLGDDVRLRLLRLVAVERLNVSELTMILGIAQSGVSRHLGLLREAGLVEEAREGGFSYYRGVSNDPDGKLSSVWTLLRERLVDEEVLGTRGAIFREDDTRLREVKRERLELRDKHGVTSSPASRQLVPGRSWEAWARALGLLLPNWTVADLGCGDGHLTLEMASWALRVIAVDRSSDVLKQARELARRRGVSNVVWRRGLIEQVPIDDEKVDMAVLSQALHHAKDPDRALAEATRIVKRSGRVLILDLKEHDHRWVADRLGDRWLGFREDQLVDMMEGAGLSHVRLGNGLNDEPFAVVVAVGHRPAA